MKKLLLLLILAPLLSFAAPSTVPINWPQSGVYVKKISMFWQDVPVFRIQDVFKDTLVLSWTKPSGSVTTVVERATDRNFTSPTTVYNGTSTTQIFIDRGLTQHTWYYYRIKALDAGSIASAWVTDSVRTFWTPTAASQGGNRIATSADLSIDPFINVGDFLIVGSDSYAEYDGWGASVGGYLGYTVPALAAGAKVCIVGDVGYDFVNLDMSLNRGKTITNVGGQVKARLGFFNMKQVLFTGKYDPVAKTGNSRFQGYALESNWAKLSGSFGFYIKGRWDHPEVLLSHMGGNTDSSTFEYIEAGAGGSSAFSIKNDGSAVPMVANTVRYIYVHDTGDEGFYIGSTQGFPQTPIIGFRIHNIIIARAGLNALQIGNMKGFNWISNLATVGSGFEYNNAFMKYQDQAIQLQPRENGYVFDSSIIAGGSGDYLNWFMQPDLTYDAPLTSQISYIRNNLWYNNKNRGGGFLQVHNQFRGTSYITGNYFGGLGGNKSTFDAYAQLYNESYARRSTFIGTAADGGSTFTIISDGNTYDSSMNNPTTTVQSGTGGSLTEANTAYVNSLQPLVFNNYMDHMVDSAYSKPERWMDKQGTKWVKNKLNEIGGYRDSRFGTMFEKIMIDNRTTSVTSLTPTVGNTVNATVGTNKAFQVGESLWFYRTAIDNGNNFLARINSYDQSTGAVNMTIDSVTGGGTFGNWAVQQELQTVIIRRVYKTNDIVRHEGRFYISLQDNNVSHTPPVTGSFTDSWWKLIVFSNGSTMPPDDLRLPSDNYYAQKGIGLSTFAGAGGGGPVPPAGGTPPRSLKIQKGTRVLIKN